MKIVHRVSASLAVLFMTAVLIVTLTELAVYCDFGFYESRYQKYKVLEDLDMTMEDVMDVTHHMMAYLKGKEQDLTVKVKVDGKKQEFFNEREKAHLKDVKKLFSGAQKIRMVSTRLSVIFAAVFFMTKGNFKKTVPVVYMAEIFWILFLVTGSAFLFLSDFSKYFMLFHELFFDNELWILDPDTDLLIRMLPEGFFFDFTFRIGVFVSIPLTILFIGSVVSVRKAKK